jgi:ferrous iron transport protein A
MPALSANFEIPPTLSLNDVKAGCDVRIHALSGPSCERLRDLGFCEQLQVRKISGGRNLICSLCGTRMAISRELAEQVLVTTVA